MNEATTANNYKGHNNFINNTDMPDDEAQKLVNQWTERINKSEMELGESMRIGERMMEIYKNKIWQEEDMAFFDSFDATPIEFSVARPLINNLISKQRQRKFRHNFVPLDIHSEKRLKAEVERQAKANAMNFSTYEEAKEFYKKYADDSYAQMITGLLKKFKDINGTKWKESECFEGGLITGGDFLKVDLDDYGRPQPKRRALSRMVWDTNAIEYDLSDAEFIGDKVRWYKNDLIKGFPEVKDQIENHFKFYTNLKGSNRFKTHRRWKDWWKFENDIDSLQVKLMDVYYRDIEERFRIIDTKTGDERMADSEQTEDEVYDMLAIKVFSDMQNELPPKEAEKMMMQDNAKEKVLAEVERRFELEIEYKPCWYQMVFTFNGLLLHQKAPYPFEGHPYMPFFPQHNDGHFNGFLEDIEDIIVALNKALSIRELMMAHSAKGMLVVDEKVLDDSDLSIDDVADEYTRIGGMLVLKLKYHKSINDVMQQVNTVGEGIPAINNIIADYDERLYRVSGVNLAQLGVTQSETPASRYKMQLAEGETTNGLMYDNFVRTLEVFAKQKLVPLCVTYARNNPTAVRRLLGESLGTWADSNYDQDFALFESAIKSGEFSFTLVPSQDNPQARSDLSDKMFEMAFGGAIPFEIALEFSNHADRHDIIRRLREYRMEQQRDQLQNQVDLQRIQKILLSDQNVDADTADRLIKKARLEQQMAREEQSGSAKMGQAMDKSQSGGGMKIKQGASMGKKESNIDKEVERQALRTSQEQNSKPKNPQQ
jgi:hypothetical protein